MPPAPPMFSMTIGWPSNSPMRCANSRASTSFGPPAANGLIMVRGRVGHSPALTPVVAATEARVTSAVMTFHMVFSRTSSWFSRLLLGFHGFFLIFGSDERDRLGHFEDSSNFDQGPLKIRFGRGCTEAKPDAEA